ARRWSRAPRARLARKWDVRSSAAYWAPSSAAPAAGADIAAHPPPMPAAAVRSSAAGTICVLLAAIGFSAKAILIKLAYAYPVDAATLLTLRLLFSAPFFVLMALWSKREAQPLTRRQWLGVAV